MSKAHLYLLTTLLYLWPVSSVAADLTALEKALRVWSGESVAPAFTYALADLNYDGFEDAVVLITDSRYCGSGGCSLVIFKGVAAGYEFVSSSTVTKAPVLLVPEKKNGWHTLSVFVAGGGATPGQVMMRFDGTNYPANPSMAPAAQTDDLQNARVLIPHGSQQLQK